MGRVFQDRRKSLQEAQRPHRSLCAPFLGSFLWILDLSLQLPTKFSNSSSLYGSTSVFSFILYPPSYVPFWPCSDVGTQSLEARGQGYGGEVLQSWCFSLSFQLTWVILGRMESLDLGHRKRESWASSPYVQAQEVEELSPYTAWRSLWDVQRDKLEEMGSSSLKRSEMYPLSSCPLIKSKLQERAWWVRTLD